MDKKKLIRASTIPMSLNIFLRGQLAMLNEYFDVIAVSSPGEELEELEKREGVKTIVVPMERHISLWKDFKSLVRMIKVFHKEKPYIVHSMTPKAGLICMIAAWINRVPVRIHTYTGLVFPTATGLSQKILIWMDRILCYCANYINPEGQGVAKDLKAFHITKKPLHIIGHGNVRGINSVYWNRLADGSDEDIPQNIRFSPITRDSLGISPIDFVFLFVGRLVKDKGINELVEAFCQLPKEVKGQKLKLLLVGPYENDLDPLESVTMSLIHDNPNIIVLGSQADVRPYYAMADLFVFPSYREGFPNTVLEAGAMELPQIVTDINGSNEIIKDGLNGVIIQGPNKKNDSSFSPMKQALYSVMLWFLEHPGERERMAKNSRRMIIDRFDQKMIFRELQKVYNVLAS